MPLSMLNVEACLFHDLDSTESSSFRKEEDILNGKYKALYSTPEYIDSLSEFILKVKGKVRINQVTDECHCVSQPGNK